MVAICVVLRWGYDTIEKADLWMYSDSAKIRLLVQQSGIMILALLNVGDELMTRLVV